jgi:ribulose-phosphate 3-epimerase
MRPGGGPYLSPSIIAADYTRLDRAVAQAVRGRADLLHVDVMDGRFVPNLTLGPPVAAALKRISPLPLDVHLMIVEPHLHLEAFLRAGADWITVHVEACPHLHSVLSAIRAGGRKAGVSLNPLTPVEILAPALPFADLVCVMGVNPGFSGQRMIPETLAKVEWLRRARAEGGLRFLIEFDGGVDPSNAPAVLDAGGDILVAGSAVYGAPDPARALRALKAIR